MSTYPRRTEPPREVTVRARIVFEDKLAEHFYLSAARFKAGVFQSLGAWQEGYCKSN